MRAAFGLYWFCWNGCRGVWAMIPLRAMLPPLTLRLLSMPRALASLTVGFEFTARNRPTARTSFLTGAHRLRKHNGMTIRPILSNTILFNLAAFVDCRFSIPVPNAGHGAVALVRLRAGRGRGPQGQRLS